MLAEVERRHAASVSATLMPGWCACHRLGMVGHQFGFPQADLCHGSDDGVGVGNRAEAVGDRTDTHAVDPRIDLREACPGAAKGMASSDGQGPGSLRQRRRAEGADGGQRRGPELPPRIPRGVLLVHVPPSDVLQYHQRPVRMQAARWPMARLLSRSPLTRPCRARQPLPRIRRRRGGGRVPVRADAASGHHFLHSSAPPTIPRPLSAANRSTRSTAARAMAWTFAGATWGGRCSGPNVTLNDEKGELIAPILAGSRAGRGMDAIKLPDADVTAVAVGSRVTLPCPASRGARLGCLHRTAAVGQQLVGEFDADRPDRDGTRQREAPDDRERGIFQQQTRAQLPVEPGDRGHRASPRRHA